MKVSKGMYWRIVFWGGMLWTVGLLNACAPTQQQEQTLTQIQSQLSVLSSEVRDSFKKSEEDTITLYEELNDEVKVLQKNQAESAVVNDQLAAALAAIEAKLDEYNTRMIKLSERLDSTEAAVTERVASLSGQMGETRGETTMTPGTLSEPRQVPSLRQPSTEQPDMSQPGEERIDPSASRMYHEAYTFYVNGDFESAIAGFQKYASQYPDSELSDIAQFWIAESFFSLGEYETALTEYDTFITKYPESDKIPDAFYSKADAYLQLERQIEAISHLKYVINQFPDSAAARRAKERLETIE